MVIKITEDRIRDLKYRSDEILYAVYRDYRMENMEERMTNRGKHKKV